MIFASAFIMLLVLTSQRTWGDSVSQTEGHLEFQEGCHVELSCLFETSYSAPTLLWYEQHPQEPPQLLVSNYGAQDEKASKGWKWTPSAEPKKKFFNLTKKSVELRDSAVYFCAMRNTNTKVVFGGGTLLQVNPNLKTSEPSIYKLQPSKEGDRDISACLITDYFPAPITVGADINNSEKVNGSVVVVKENGKETPSYGTVVWGKGKKAGDCYAEYNNSRFQPESAEAATTCSEKTTGGFETDERLNLLSLTVLGLRVIFLKCVAFNLLFTFHAWSS